MGAYIHWWMSSYDAVVLKAFWIDARWLLGEAGSSLRSLYLLGGEVSEDVMFKRAANSVPSWALSGKAFLKLDSLTIVHSELYS